MQNPDFDPQWTIEIGALRFIERETETGTKRILQRYEWSQRLQTFDFFDVPLVSETEGEKK